MSKSDSESEKQEMVFVVYGASLDGEVIEALEDLGIKTYTKWVRARGVGNASEPHLDSHVWPGNNNVVAVVLGSHHRPGLLAAVRGIKERAAQEGIKAFVVPVLEVV